MPDGSDADDGEEVAATDAEASMTVQVDDPTRRARLRKLTGNKIAMLIVIATLSEPATASDNGVSSALAAFARKGSAAQRLALSGTAPISSYIRLRRTRSSLDLETATVALSLVDEQRGRPFELGLVSTVHLAEPPYYAALQREADDGGYDRVLFELLADDSVVQTDASGARRLTVPLEPS